MNDTDLAGGQPARSMALQGVVQRPYGTVRSDSWTASSSPDKAKDK